MVHTPSLNMSVVTAVYNRKTTIESALRSVQEQTYPHVEHVIQDGGSTDGTLDILRNFKAPNLEMESRPDAGLYDAINKGIARAKGDVVGLMHSDDYFASPEALSDIANAFEDPDVDGVYGDLDYISADDTGRIIRKWRSGPYQFGNLKRGWMPPHPTLYLRRSVFETWGLYDTTFQIAADYDAMLRYLVQGRINLAYVPKVIVKMRVGGESNRSIGRIVQKSREDYRALRRNGVGGLQSLTSKNLSKLRQFL
ncbi:MAG: glycosyltransferase family 2 protein [Pseudomonadota bacterium]